MTKPVIPVPGQTKDIPETPEQIKIREDAERLANGGKTLAEIEVEKNNPDPDEAARLAAERAANGGKTLAEIEAERVANASKLILEIEGVDTEFTLDAEGNALDASGKVVYTAAQIKEFSEEEDTNNGSQLSAIVALSGVKVLNPDGTEKVYEDTVEGFAQREVDIKQLGYTEGASKAMDLFFKNNPELKSMYDYKRVNGSLENYSSFVDYSAIKLDSQNEGQLIDMIVAAEVAKGTTRERALRIANLSKMDNTLLVDAQDSQKYLVDSQAASIKRVEEQEAAAIQAEIEKEQKLFGIAYDEKGNAKVLNIEGSIYDMVVTKGKVGSITIPKDGVSVKQTDGTIKQFSRNEIFDYIYVPKVEIDGEYYTQAQVDEYKRTLKADELVATYIRNLLGGDIQSLVRTAARQSKADEVRKVVVKSMGKSTINANSGGTQKIVFPIKN